MPITAGVRRCDLYHRQRKKEEFPGFMENMLPGNSFPQICVVSVNECVEKGHSQQDYLRRVYLSNLL